MASFRSMSITATAQVKLRSAHRVLIQASDASVTLRGNEKNFLSRDSGKEKMFFLVVVSFKLSSCACGRCAWLEYMIRRPSLYAPMAELHDMMYLYVIGRESWDWGGRIDV